MVGLQRAHPAAHDGVHELEVRRVRHQREVDRARLEPLDAVLADDGTWISRVGAGAVVVLHVAGAALGQIGPRSRSPGRPSNSARIDA